MTRPHVSFSRALLAAMFLVALISIKTENPQFLRYYNRAITYQLFRRYGSVSSLRLLNDETLCLLNS